MPARPAYISPMRLDAVLMELEGVLADTAALRRAALRRSLAEDGVVLDDDAARAGDARATRDAVERAARLAGVALDEVALDLAALRADRHLSASLGDGVVLAPGAGELVERLAGRVRLGVATRLPRADADRVLALAGLEWAFELVVAAEDADAKPSPAPYALALARLARRRPLADAVLALEDGAAGIAAATAAGVRCVAVGEMPAHEAMRADGVLPSLDGATLERLAGAAGLRAAEAR